MLCDLGLHAWLGVPEETFVWRTVGVVPGSDLVKQVQYEGQLCSRCGIHRWRRWLDASPRLGENHEQT